MGPTARYVVRGGGCGRFLGIAFVVAGAVILLSYYGVIPGHITKWWPALIIALGILLLVRHYWRLFRRRDKARGVIDSTTTQRALWGRGGMSPPALPIVIIAVGVYLLLSNLHRINLGVVIAAVLILLGGLFLAGSLRGRAPE